MGVTNDTRSDLHNDTQRHLRFPETTPSDTHPRGVTKYPLGCRCPRKGLILKIKLGRCRCTAIVYMVEEAGLVWTADTEALDAQQAVAALTAGRELYRITRVGETYLNLAPATPAVLGALRTEPGERPVVVPSHGCPPGAARGLATPFPGRGAQPTPQRPPAGQQTPSSGPLRAVSGATSAATPGSECSVCRAPLDDPQTRILVELGATVIDAYHAGPCP